MGKSRYSFPMGRRTLFALTIVVFVIAVLQKTPLAFLPEDAADFVWGMVGGLVIGSVITWLAGRE